MSKLRVQARRFDAYGAFLPRYSVLPPFPRPRGVTLAAEKFDEGKKEGEKKSKSCVASIRTPLRHFDNAFVTRCFLLFLEISSISSSSIREITQFLALERKKKKRKETRFQRSGFETKEI